MSGEIAFERAQSGEEVIAHDAGAVRETLRGGGLLLREKPLELVAELVHEVLTRPELKQAVLASQARAMAEVRGTDFGALLLDRLAPVLA